MEKTEFHFFHVPIFGYCLHNTNEVMPIRSISRCNFGVQKSVARFETEVKSTHSEEASWIGVTCFSRRSHRPLDFVCVNRPQGRNTVLHYFLPFDLYSSLPVPRTAISHCEFLPPLHLTPEPGFLFCNWKNGGLEFCCLQASQLPLRIICSLLCLFWRYCLFGFEHLLFTWEWESVYAQKLCRFERLFFVFAHRPQHAVSVL